MAFDIQGARAAGYSDAEIAEFLASHPGTAKEGSGLVKQAVSGVAEGIAHIPSAAAELANAAGDKAQTWFEKLGLASPEAEAKRKELRDLIASNPNSLPALQQKLTEALPAPVDETEKVARESGRMLPAILTGSKVGLPRAAVAATGAGAGSEIAGNLAQGTGYETPARMAGAVLGGGAAAAAPEAAAATGRGAFNGVKAVGTAMADEARDPLKLAGAEMFAHMVGVPPGVVTAAKVANRVYQNAKASRAAAAAERAAAEPIAPSGPVSRPTGPIIPPERDTNIWGKMADEAAASKAREAASVRLLPPPNSASSPFPGAPQGSPINQGMAPQPLGLPRPGGPIPSGQGPQPLMLPPPAQPRAAPVTPDVINAGAPLAQRLLANPRFNMGAPAPQLALPGPRPGPSSPVTGAPPSAPIALPGPKAAPAAAPVAGDGLDIPDFLRRTPPQPAAAPVAPPAPITKPDAVVPSPAPVVPEPIVVQKALNKVTVKPKAEAKPAAANGYANGDDLAIPDFLKRTADNKPVASQVNVAAPTQVNGARPATIVPSPKSQLQAEIAAQRAMAKAPKTQPAALTPIEELEARAKPSMQARRVRAEMAADEKALTPAQKIAARHNAKQAPKEPMKAALKAEKPAADNRPAPVRAIDEAKATERFATSKESGTKIRLLAHTQKGSMTPEQAADNYADFHESVGRGYRTNRADFVGYLAAKIAGKDQIAEQLAKLTKINVGDMKEHVRAITGRARAKEVRDELVKFSPSNGMSIKKVLSDDVIGKTWSGKK